MMIRAFVVLAMLALAAAAGAQPTAFTYQGHLKSGTQTASGPHDFRFRLWDAASGGTQLGTTQCSDNLPVAGGVFTATIDFGQRFASPEERFLEIEVRADTGLGCGDAGGFVVLSPRMRIAAAPAASHALSAFSLVAADGSPAASVIVDNDGDVGVGTGTPDLLGYGGRVLSLAGDRPRFEFQGSSATSSNLGIIDFLNGSAGAAAIIAVADPATASAHLNFNTKSLWLTGGNGAGLPTSAGPGLRMYYDAAGDRAHIFAFNYQNATPRALILQDLPGANVGIGTSSPQARLDVRGDIRLGHAGQFRAAAGDESLRIIRGTIDANGTILNGQGFTAERLSAADYLITFTTPFSAAPTVTATVDDEIPSLQDVHYFVAGVYSPTAQSVQVRTRAHSASHLFPTGPTGQRFHFIAVGPR